MNKIRYCEKCKEYTLKEVCSCGQKTIIRAPMRYSPKNKNAKYRRIARKPILKKKGLL